MKIKRFSGYSESSPNGTTYHNSQVISEYVINPIDKSINKLGETPLGSTNLYKRKRDRIKRIINPLKEFFNKENNK